MSKPDIPGEASHEAPAKNPAGGHRGAGTRPGGFDGMGLGLEQQAVKPQWGEVPKDHFGYASDQERLAKRGMEDWELVTKIPTSQRRVPYWFLAVVVIVLLIAVGLGFPFWGQRPGVKVQWFNWGFVAAIFYVAGAGLFVYYMTNLYGSERAGRLDSDPEKARKPEPAPAEDSREDRGS